MLKEWSARSKPKKSITAGELIRRLEDDPEYVRRKTEREKEIAGREAQSRLDQAPLLKDLAEVGIQIESVWDLVNMSSSYRPAIPVLLKHLRMPYPDGIREGIARALAIRPTRPLGWKVLVDEFRKTAPANQRVKDGLAVALAGACDRSVLPELISLAKDKSQGSARVLLLLGIRRSRSPEAMRAIEELASDPQLSTEIKSWRRHVH